MYFTNRNPYLSTRSYKSQKHNIGVDSRYSLLMTCSFYSGLTVGNADNVIK